MMIIMRSERVVFLSYYWQQAVRCQPLYINFPQWIQKVMA